MLNKWFTALGVVNTICFAVYTVLSYGLTPVVPYGKASENEAEFFNRLARSLSFLGGNVQTFISGQATLTRQEILLLLAGPTLVSTGVFLLLLVLLAYHHREIDTNAPLHLFQWTVAFAVVSLLAFPVLTQDLWLSVAWGRMIVAGFNPYHNDFMWEFALDLPLDFGLRMTYGPLWAVISSLVVWFARGHSLLSAVLFKLLLAIAWLGSLRVIWLLLRRQPLWHQCLGIVIFGWLPLSVTQTIAEGHNDVLMVLFMLLWLYWLYEGKPVAASLSLAVSVLIKYVTAPLFFLDFLYLYYSRRQRFLKYLPAMLAAATLMAVVFGLFYRSTDFFAATTSMRWYFYRPADAGKVLENLLGVKLYTPQLILWFFPLLALWLIVDYTRRPIPEKFYKAVLAVMSAVLFSAVSHVWPWFLLWVLAVMALVVGSALTRWLLGVALAMPFPIQMWMAFRGIGHFYYFDIATLAVYTFAILWLIFAPRRWFPEATPTEIGYWTVERFKSSVETILARNGLSN